MNDKRKSTALFVFLVILSAVFIFPVLVVFMNSFKSKFSIMGSPFSLPDSETFTGLENYITGIRTAGMGGAFLRSLFITAGSVTALVFFCSMTAWYIVRSGDRFSKALYRAFLFSMVVPFQMLMYSMTYVVTVLKLNNPLGIIPVYLGFGAGLTVFMLTGFIRSIPAELEEAAQIDGCSPPQIFFKVVFPVLRPMTVTVSILNAMWIWNDYLLPYLVLGSRNKTLPVTIQIAMQGAYGSVNWGGFMAMLVLAILPIIIFYLIGQKYIIEGVIAGAVKG